MKTSFVEIAGRKFFDTMSSSIREKVQNIPEFSEKNYEIAGYVAGTAVTLSGLFLIYEVLSSGSLHFSAEWNMFHSPLGTICYFIGLVWAIAWWGKFTHWSATPVIETRDRSGNVLSRKEDMDITEQGFAKIIMPLLGHFVIEPLIYGAIIYYPIQCVIAILGAIFPYVVSLFVLVVIALSWAFSRKFNFRYHSVVLVGMGLLFTVAFAYGGYAIAQANSDSSCQESTQEYNVEEDDGSADNIPADYDGDGNYGD